MKTSLDCMECNIKQLIKVSKMMNVSEELTEEASKQVFKMLSEISFEHTNPFIMGKTFDIIKKVYKNNNPYKDIKAFYNKIVLDMYSELEKIIFDSSDSLDTALKLSVVGNLIDFGARHTFNQDILLNKVKNYRNIVFNIDHTKKLKNELLSAKTIFYIGDNCGEIVFDKLFIEEIKRQNPNCEVFFAVRGDAILNDVTKEDALEVGMEDVAKIISSEMAVPGTILSGTPKEFQQLFWSSDVVVAKGQGNFESLSEQKRENLYLMLMAKCDYVSKVIGCNMMDYVVVENVN